MLLLYRKKYFFVSDLKVYCLFNCLILLGRSLNKLVAFEVKEFLCPEISIIGPLSSHARNERIFGAKFNFTCSGKFLLCRA